MHALLFGGSSFLDSLPAYPQDSFGFGKSGVQRHEVRLKDFGAEIHPL